MSAKNPSPKDVAAPRPSRNFALFLLLTSLTISPPTVWGQALVGSEGTMEVVSKPSGTTPAGNIGGALGGKGGFGGSSGGIFGQLGGFGATTVRLEFKIAPNTPLQDLLPPPPMVGRWQPPWLVKDLTQVTEVFFQKPLEIKKLTAKDFEHKTHAENEALRKQFDEAQKKVRAEIAQMLAKINYVNQAETDKFVLMLTENRSDLAGMPFLRGAACRMSKEISRQFVQEVFPGGSMGMSGNIFGEAGGLTLVPSVAPPRKPQPNRLTDIVVQARLAAWMQTSPENKPKRQDLVKTLGAIKHPATTTPLASWQCSRRKSLSGMKRGGA